MNVVRLHLMVNHLPVMATALALLLLLVALVRAGERGFWASGTLLLVVASLGALLTLQTGEAAEEVIEGLPGVVPALVEAHEERASVGVGVCVVVGVLAAAGWWWGRLRAWATVRALLVTTLVLAAFSGGVLAWVGASGGGIRHPELHSTGVVPG